LNRHPGESRGPEHPEITGFRLSPERRILRNFDFLRIHQSCPEGLSSGITRPEKKSGFHLIRSA
jgi:hypothetical protein